MQKIISESVNRKEYLYAFVIAISCIMLQYDAAVSTIGAWVLVLCFLGESLHNKSFPIDKETVEILFVIVIQELISLCYFTSDFTIFWKQVGNIIFILMIFSFGTLFTDTEAFYKCYKIVGFICTLVVLMQTVYVLVTKNPVSPIYLLPNDGNIANWAFSTYRASGFFPEPQVFCCYMIPLLVLALGRDEFYFSLYLTIGMLFSGSSLGIICCFILWISYFASSTTKINKKVATIVLLILAIVFFFTGDIFEIARNKLLSIFSDFSSYSQSIMNLNTSYSNYQRLLKGWVTLIEMPLFDKIIGTGIGATNFMAYITKTGVHFSWSNIWNASSTGAAYYTSAAGVFIECGLIVGALYYLFIIQKIRKGNSITKKLMVIFLIMSFSTQTFLNGIFIFYFLIYFVYQDKYQRE